jgi:hypothetical protein
MSDEHDDKEDPAEQLRQGLGLLWRAARGAAVGVKKEMDKTELGRSIEDAGRELARAASNVVERLSGELNEIARKPGSPGRRHDPWPDEAPPPREDADDDEFDGVKAPQRKTTGPTPEDPGFRISIDDDDKKPR